MSVLTPKQQQRMTSMMRISENKACFDCGSPQPLWANTTFGVFICMGCAGIHRSLGTHISKIQSINLDSWTEENLRKMECIGNKGGRILYEYNMPSLRSSQTRQSSGQKKILTDKYVLKLFFHPQMEELREEMIRQGVEPDVEKPSSLKVDAPLPPPPAPPIEELWGPPRVAPTRFPESTKPLGALFGTPGGATSTFPAQTSGFPSSSSFPVPVEVGPSPKMVSSPSSPYSSSSHQSNVSAQEEIISLFSASQTNSTSKRAGFAW